MAKMKLVVENVKKLKSHVLEDYFMKIQNVCQCHMFVMVSKVTLALYPQSIESCNRFCCNLISF